MRSRPILIVPGLRDHAAQHWQTLLAARLPNARSVEPMGREDLDCQRRVDALEREAEAIGEPAIIVAHSAGVLTVAHWAAQTELRVAGALLAVPPDFEREMPSGYPSIEALHGAGWSPVPRRRLPFPSIVAASRNDPLAAYARVEELAACWGSQLVDLGEAGHLNPASGFGEWPMARTLIAELEMIRVL